MGGYAVLVWIPSGIREGKRRIIEAEVRRLHDKTDTRELGRAKWWSGEHVSESESLLMLHKGLKYIPEIIDSMIFGLDKALDRLHLERPAPKYRKVIKEEMRNLYPHSAELMKKVNASIKKIEGFDISYFFCWPVEVVGLKEVSDEVDVLLKGNLFSNDNLKDRKIFEKAIGDMGFSRDELEKKPLNQLIDEAIEYKNARMKRWGKFFKGAYEIQKEYSVQLYFLAAPFL